MKTKTVNYQIGPAACVPNPQKDERRRATRSAMSIDPGANQARKDSTSAQHRNHSQNTATVDRQQTGMVHSVHQEHSLLKAAVSEQPASIDDPC